MITTEDAKKLIWDQIKDMKKPFYTSQIVIWYNKKTGKYQRPARGYLQPDDSVELMNSVMRVKAIKQLRGDGKIKRLTVRMVGQGSAIWYSVNNGKCRKFPDLKLTCTDEYALKTIVRNGRAKLAISYLKRLGRIGKDDV